MIPEQPKNSFRVTITVGTRKPRLDTPLHEALQAQDTNLTLKKISKAALKELFNKSRIQIKGQRAKSSSALAAGTTYVDILGFE